MASGLRVNVLRPSPNEAGGPAVSPNDEKLLP